MAPMHPDAPYDPAEGAWPWTAEEAIDLTERVLESKGLRGTLERFYAGYIDCFGLSERLIALAEMEEEKTQRERWLNL